MRAREVPDHRIPTGRSAVHGPVRLAWETLLRGSPQSLLLLDEEGKELGRSPMLKAILMNRREEWAEAEVTAWQSILNTWMATRSGPIEGYWELPAIGNRSPKILRIKKRDLHTEEGTLTLVTFTETQEHRWVQKTGQNESLIMAKRNEA
jgi:hypothetical protein